MNTGYEEIGDALVSKKGSNPFADERSEGSVFISALGITYVTYITQRCKAHMEIEQNSHFLPT